ncbi:transposase, partial [Segatella copri]|uniref:transposase n=1 Tax=Segatella copri TaxID=165179 RepID=UPI00345FFAE6
MVYTKPNLCDPKVVAKYISRYLVRPVIVTSRIDQHDGNTVTFHYNPHQDNLYIEETVPVIDLIKHLIRHIPEKHYKMIPYGVLYARHRKIDSKLHHVISKETRRIYRSCTRLRTAILLTFGYDPLYCSECNHNGVHG